MKVVLRKRIFYTALLPVINLSICYLLIYWTYIYLYMNLSILLLLSVLFIHRKDNFFQFFPSLSLRFLFVQLCFLSTPLNLFSFFSLSSFFFFI